LPLELRLAWRNVWRNPRRTALTVAATVFAVLLVVFFVAMAAGVHEKMIEDAVRVNSGHVMVSGRDYLEKRSLEQFVHFDAGLEQAVAATPGVLGYAPRVVSFGLLSKQISTRGVAVLGVDPERESDVTTLARRVEQGSFLEGRRPREIVLGQRLARNLGAELGDELLLYSVAYSLETAYELFEVVGVLKLPEAELDRSLAVISLADAQEFFVYGDRVSEVAILARDANRAPAIQAALRSVLTGEPPAEVHTWSESMPELVQFILLDDAGMYIMLVILVVVVAFGILNTILMAVLERQREFGVLLALGLRPAAVFRIVYLESLMLAATGLVIGFALSIPLVLWFQAHPVPLSGDDVQGALALFGMEPELTWKLKPMNPIGSVATILGVAIVAALYPALKASRGRPVDVLRGL
jgi:ABC-type lipoprotein release transport system permease subunit